MAEIRCPHCGEVFQVDETEYAQIVRQVRDAEFRRELDARERSAERERESAVEAAVARVRQESLMESAQKDTEIAQLKALWQPIVEQYVDSSWIDAVNAYRAANK